MPAEGRDEGLLLGSYPSRQEENMMNAQPGKVGESARKSATLSTRKEIEQVRILAETVVLVALSGALYLFRFFLLPQGGGNTWFDGSSLLARSPERAAGRNSWRCRLWPRRSCRRSLFWC